MNFHTNELSGALSPYLLQHAHNPVAWKMWNEQTLSLAKNSDRPIFLSIGYATCHSCHVMEKETFNNQEFANFINEHFVCIKVDREERPDIDHLYMKACQAITGQGGWPLTCFLSPDGAPLFAGTYFPLHDLNGRPGVWRLAKAISEMYANQKQKLLLDSARILQAVAQDSSVNSDPTKIRPGLLEAGLEELRNRFDSHNGGFGDHPKFPNPHNLNYLLRAEFQQPDDFNRFMIDKSLSAMAQKGLRDHLGGGFFRYSTDAGWHIPHFEKMLYDNALLLFSYAEAARALNKDEFKTICEEIVSYIDEQLRLPEGGIASAQDADSEGVEGKFYTWNPLELEDFFDELYDAFREDFEMGPVAEFKTQNSPLTPQWHLQRKGPLFSKTPLQDSLQKLKMIRNQRTPPLRDDKVLLDWNSLYVAALAKAGKILNNSSWVLQAENDLNWLWENFQAPEGHFYHRYRLGQVGIDAHLEDYAYFIWALLEVYQGTGNSLYLQRSLQLANLLESEFKDPESGAYFFSSAKSHSLILRTLEFYDGAVPAAQSVLAWCYLRLYNQTQLEFFQQGAEDILLAYGERMEQHPSSFCFTLKALHLKLHSQPILSTNAPKSVDSILEIHQLKFHPDLDLLWLSPEHPSPPSNPQALSTSAEENWMLCKNHSCSPVFSSPLQALEGL